MCAPPLLPIPSPGTELTLLTTGSPINNAPESL